MKLIRGILLGVLIWVLIFFEVSILMFGFKLSAGIVYYCLHFLFSSLFVIIISLIYFRGKKIKKGFLQGILLGVIFVITGDVLDSVITIPLWIIPQGGSYASFLLDKAMLLNQLWEIILCGFVGWVKKR